MRTASVDRQLANIMPLLELDVSELCRQWLAAEPLFLDTETTGLDERAEIVELAVVNGQGKALIDTLIKPASPIPAKVTELHGISNKMVEDSPTWWDIHRKLGTLLCGRNIIAYNSRFDSRMLGQTCAIYRLSPIPANWFCAMRMYKEYTCNHKRVKLIRAATECGVTLPEQEHRALADVLMCMGVMREMARED